MPTKKKVADTPNKELVDQLIDYVVSRLPDDYDLSKLDREWLAFISTRWDGETNHKNICDAVRRSVEVARETEDMEDYLVDPWELFIDANIADKQTQPAMG